LTCLADARIAALGALAFVGEDLHLDGARAQGLDAEIVGEILRAGKQQARHRHADDDRFPSAEIGRDGSGARHEANSNARTSEPVYPAVPLLAISAPTVVDLTV
jgi:hypothetical protein